MAIYSNKYSRHVPTEPHGGEVAPAQLPDHMVLVVKQVPDLHRMVPSCNKTDVIFIVYQYYYIIATTITLYIKSIFFFLNLLSYGYISMQFVSYYKSSFNLYMY